ncbi:MAG TPA: class I SAM-dependent methyltransferase [Candidatus Binatia bacterium]|nr:class I SAM-dependent methyltransferase [Candidatus Binatia bacterium]
MTTLKDVQHYWDEYPCGIQVSDKEFGSREFFDEIKKKFDRTYAAYAHSEKLLRFRERKGKSVLEIGCGIGIDAAEFARHGAQVTTLDLSPNNIELAKKYFSYNNLSGNLLVGNAEAMDFEDDTFDVVVAIGVFIYTPDTQKAINEVLRVVKPGGEVICMFWNRISWYPLLVRLSGGHFDHEEKDAPLIKLYSAKEIRKMFEKFSTVEIETDRFPTKTIKRAGLLATVYNYGLVPLCRLIPKRLIKPFGFHIIVEAVK